ncbi:pyrimidine/purine nucleoside phosphorylase [Luteolibacter ambystomatis]|uniref:Pyrimidine/purine nucleoside phosphorylase n=1 Tax=Luteolibacter ambystomatis TaxID=2824561 RepID=A0A975G9S0_9BACT|nr:pyrimidine/purine nucleoside phosphorylase [Luteolibacter ambystomatis]QUE50980.1 pyrimidine/purine nucleoside phosphorylase [Luteolibacter ambystomatis]
MSTPSFSNVTVDAKANVYFDGKVVSHTVRFDDGTKKTVGLIYAGEYHFGTGAPERMEIIAGECSVVLDGASETLKVAAGSHFDVAGNSGFTIHVAEGICEYVCSFLEA